MNSKTFSVVVVYLMAFVTGILFVAVPALATVFTNREIFDLSQSQFGKLFLPQTGFIIAASLGAPFLVNRLGSRKILIGGLVLMLLSMGGLWFFRFFIADKDLIFIALLVLVSFIAAGFGLTITTLNPVVAAMFPKAEASAILILQFLVGVGTSTSPLLSGLFGDKEHWIYIPGIIFILLLTVFILFLPVKTTKETLFSLPKGIIIPRKLWGFIVAIIIYGFLEGTFGGFGSVLLTKMGLPVSKAALGLSLFWGGVAVNRLLFGWGARFVNLSRPFLSLPLIVGLLLLILPFQVVPTLIMILMFLTGFFMGSIFPGVIAWGTVEFPAYAVMVSGFIMASDMIGTGIVTQILGSYDFGIKTVCISLAVMAGVIFCLLILFSGKSKIDEAF